MNRIKNMMNLKNKSGFTLLEIIIAMGLATGLLIFLMKMQGESAKKAKTAKVNQEVETFFNDFKAIIDRPGFCSKSFENITLANNSLQAIDKIKNSLGDIRYAVGEVYGTNSVKLNAIELKDFKPDDAAGLEGTATLELTLERIGKIYGGNIVKRTMEVSVSRDSSHKILACGALGSTGGVNINIVVPQAAISPTPTPTPTVTTTLPSIKPPTTTVPAEKMPTQEEIMKELQNNPQLKEMMESLKGMQKQDE
jgi:type II secretory pathway pseudopilin PulG